MKHLSEAQRSTRIMQSIVSIDIETTGLSDERDAIIEIGAVKFKGHRVEDEWSSLINPGKHIPRSEERRVGKECRL